MPSGAAPPLVQVRGTKLALSRLPPCHRPPFLPARHRISGAARAGASAQAQNQGGLPCLGRSAPPARSLSTAANQQRHPLYRHSAPTQGSSAKYRQIEYSTALSSEPLRPAPAGDASRGTARWKAPGPRRCSRYAAAVCTCRPAACLGLRARGRSAQYGGQGQSSQHKARGQVASSSGLSTGTSSRSCPSTLPQLSRTEISLQNHP